ncbi:MAG: hypothetical protein FWC91_10895 [Defluviitaleaceae bacterium]|nr:hypothetical protein [Defluviitaleaceae bacterium]
MKSMKRFVSIIIGLAMIFTIITPATPVLANDAVVISARPVGSGFELNDPVTVEIYIENPAARSIGSISFLEFHFDSNVLEWDLPPNGISAYNRGSSSGWPFAAGNISNAQQLTLNAPEHISQSSVRFSFDSAQDFRGSGVLVTLNLRVRANAILAPTTVDLAWTTSSNRPGAGMNCFYMASPVNTELRSGTININEALGANVGEQSGTMIAGMDDSVTFPVITTLVDAGVQPISVQNLPVGVTAPWDITIYPDGTGTLTLTGSTESTAGEFDLTLSIAGTTSPSFTLTIVGTSVSVGEQSGSLIEGVEGTVTFPVTTENLPVGTHPIMVQNLPIGALVQEDFITINNDGTGTFTLIATGDVAAGTHSDLILSVGDVTSSPFSLTVRRSSILPHEPPVNIQAVGTNVAEWFSGTGTLSWPQVNDALTPVSRGVGRHYLAFDRTLHWATTASYAIVTITADGITVRDGFATWYEGPIDYVAGGTNAKLLSYPDSTNLYIAWGTIPPGFVQLENNELRFN